MYRINNCIGSSVCIIARINCRRKFIFYYSTV
nr:MAG TPA: hypothetical protein [Caudoviricetes sp.]